MMMMMSMRISSPPATAPTMIISMFSMISGSRSPSITWKVWISAFWGAFRRCYSVKSKCGTMTALSSTCHTNRHFCIPHSHVILRHALVGASVRRAEGSPKSQGPIRVGNDTFRQLSARSANRTTQSFITTNPSILKSR